MNQTHINSIKRIYICILYICVQIRHLPQHQVREEGDQLHLGPGQGNSCSSHCSCGFFCISTDKFKILYFYIPHNIRLINGNSWGNQLYLFFRMGLSEAFIQLNTLCTRSLVHFYVMSILRKQDNTSWTFCIDVHAYSSRVRDLNPTLKIFLS